MINFTVYEESVTKTKRVVRNVRPLNDSCENETVSVLFLCKFQLGSVQYYGKLGLPGYRLRVNLAGVDSSIE